VLHAVHDGKRVAPGMEVRPLHIKVITAQAMKVRRGSRGVAPFILNLDTSWRLVDFTPRPLYPREGNPVPVE
jgi:hypothetical protein